jgi:hypothetical protein
MAELEDVFGIDDVIADDAHFVDEMAMALLDPVEESAALEAMLAVRATDGLVCSSCLTTIGEEKWKRCIQVWETHCLGNSDLGVVIQQVIDNNAAPHLRPTGVQKRLQEGVKPACWWLYKLMTKIEDLSSTSKAESKK